MELDLVRELFDENKIVDYNVNLGRAAYTSSGTTQGGWSTSASTPVQGAITISSSGANAAITTPGGPNNITSGTAVISGVVNWPGSAGGTGGNGIWITSPYNQPANGGWGQAGGGTWTVPGIEYWPQVKDGIGIVFVDGDLIKLKTKNGKEVVIGKLSESEEEVIPLEAIIAKKRLLEGTKEEGQT